MAKSTGNVKVPSLKEMFDNALYFGHRTEHWNPKFRDYIFGEKGGVHIIDLEKTRANLEEALNFLAECAESGKELIVVATKTQARKLVRPIFGDTPIHFVDSKWLPGLLSNFDTVKKRITYYNKLIEMRKTGEMEKYSKKEVSEFSKDIKKLEVMLGGVLNMRKVPQVIFILDIFKEKIALKEAKVCKIPTIGVVDSNSDPRLVDFPIPANDDAQKSIKFILELVKETWLNNIKQK